MPSFAACIAWTHSSRYRIGLAALSVVLALSSVAVHAVAQAALRAGLRAAPVRIDALGAADPARVDMLENAVRGLPFVSSVTRVHRDAALAQAGAGSSDVARLIAAYPVGNPFPEALSVTLAGERGYDELFAMLEQGEYDDVLGPAVPAVRAQARNAMLVVRALHMAESLCLLLAALATAVAALVMALLPAYAESDAEARRSVGIAAGAGAAGFLLTALCLVVFGNGVGIVREAVGIIVVHVLLAYVLIAAWPGVVLLRLRTAVSS